jgi:PAS domain S-box-containing protein
MKWWFSLYVALLFVTASLTGGVAWFTLRQHKRPGGLPLGLLMLAITAWSFATALEMMAVDIPSKIFWSKVSYPAITTSPLLLFLFAWEVAHQRKGIGRPALILLSVIPAITVLLATTNEFHHLIWTSFTPVPIPGTNLILYGHGTWFWIMMANTYCLISAATFLLAQSAFRFRHLHRVQFTLLVLSIIPPWVVNVVYVFELSPVPGMDLTPASFTLTALTLAYSFYRLQFLNILPVAYDKVIEELQDGTLILDTQGRLADINPAAQRLIGIEGEPPIGQPAEKILANWANTGERFWDAHKLQTEIEIDGLGYVEWRSTPLHDQGEHITGRLILLRDVTPRRQAEEALRELNATLEAQVAARTAEICSEQERSEAVLQSVDDGIFTTDPEMRIRYVNPAFMALTGYTAEEIIGEHGVLVIVGSNLGLVWQAMEPALAEGQSWQGEVSAQHSSGRPYDADLTVSAVRGAKDQLEGYVFTLRDISRRKNLERARAHFLDNVSHQFRTPLTTLQLYLHLARQSDIPHEEIKRNLDAMASQITWLNHLTQDVLEMAALDAGQAATAWESVSIADVIEDAVARHRKRAEAAGLNLTVLPHTSELPTVEGDRDRLLQALSEVLENAIVFTPAGEEVTVEAQSDGQIWAIITVTDTGPGIPPDEQERVFERFFRGRLTEAGDIPGTGLGLSIAHDILLAHGGRITVESGKSGSTFRLWLPTSNAG